MVSPINEVRRVELQTNSKYALNSIEKEAEYHAESKKAALMISHEHCIIAFTLFFGVF